MKYPFFVQRAERNYAATAAQFPTLATHANRAELERLMAEGLALQLHAYAKRGEQAPEPLAKEELDLSNYEGEDVEVVLVESARLNPVSLEIERAIRASGLSEAEVARRIGTSRAAMTRITDPFYWGHSLSTLHKLADALGVDLEVSLRTRAA